MGSKRKQKDRQADSHWSLVKFIRKLFCGNKRKKAKKEKKREEDEPSSSFDETSGGTNSPAAVSAPSSPDRSPPKPSTKLVTGNEQVVCFNAGVNAKKIEQVKKSIEKAVNKQGQQPQQNGKRKPPKKEPPTANVLPKSRVDHAISRRDKTRIEERRAKLKQLKSADKKPTKGAPRQNIQKERFQLPIGTRGYNQGTADKPNRFSLTFIPEEAILSSSEPSVEAKHMCVLFRRLIKVNYNLEIVQHSYKDIVKSLIKLQVPANKQKEVSKKWNSELASEASSATDGKHKPSKGDDIDSTLDRMTVARLLAPATRREAMIELQALVDELNMALDDLHVYYDDEKETFDFEEYCTSEFRITMDQYEIVLSRTEKLLVVLEELLEHYSKELINLFDLPVVH